jgi:predicted tellurium resistance membrane protein TerC
MRHALSFILIMVGLKMLLQEVISLPILYTLSGIGIILLGAIILSWRRQAKARA